jgi:5-methylcytosine-specific restriction endonuclease McrA
MATKKTGRPVRPDREAGNRGAYEKARRRVLATQTICGICGKPVDFSYKYPHPLSPTVDHIIPVSKGGHPSDMDNLQLAHRCCNREKSDKIVMGNILAEGEGGPVSNDTLEQHANWIQYRSTA